MPTSATLPSPASFQARARLVDFMRQADEPGLINLAAGVPGLDSLPAAALHDAYERAYAREGARLFAYHHPEGDHGLRELLAARLQGRGATHLRGSQIISVTGCTQALQLLLSVLVKPGEIVAVEAPGYYGLLELLSVAGARVLPLPIRGPDGFDLDQTAELLARWKPRCLIVCTAISNPSGVTMPPAHRSRLVELCREHQVRLIEDDIYGELVEGGALPTMLADDPGGDTVSYVTSFSKTVSPGLRAGVCIPGSLYEAVAARKCQQDLHSSVPTEAALREFLEAGELDPHLETLRARNLTRRTLALEAVQRTFPEGTEVRPPRGGYMLWAELPGRYDLESLRLAARAQNVAFGAGPVFYTQEPERSALRLNCAKASETDLVRGIELLGQLLSSMAPA